MRSARFSWQPRKPPSSLASKMPTWGVEMWLKIWKQNKLTPPLKDAGRGQHNEHGSIIDKKTGTKRNETHMKRTHYLETCDKAGEGLIFKQGDTHGCSWSECLGESEEPPEHTRSISGTLGLSVRLWTFPFQSPNILPAQKPRECLTMSWKSFNQAGSILSRKGMGCGVWGKRRAKKSPMLLPVSSHHTGFNQTTCQPLRSHRIVSQSASFLVILAWVIKTKMTLQWGLFL